MLSHVCCLFPDFERLQEAIAVRCCTHPAREAIMIVRSQIMNGCSRPGSWDAMLRCWLFANRRLPTFPFEKLDLGVGARITEIHPKSSQGLRH